MSPDRPTPHDRGLRHKATLAAIREHYLTRALPAAFSWLVSEAGYERSLTPYVPGSLRADYWTERTCIRVSANVQTVDNAAVHVSLAPPGDTYCTLNQYLEAHGLEPLNLWVPITTYPDSDRLLRTLDIASQALRRLTRWELAGEWGLAG
jgi:hypothetical protein